MWSELLLISIQICFYLTTDIHHARFPLFLPMIDDWGTDQIFCHVKKIQNKLRRLMMDTEKWSMHWISKILICQWLVPGFISGYRYQCQKSSQSVILKISHDPTFHTLTEKVGLVLNRIPTIWWNCHNFFCLFQTVERLIETGECQNLYVRQKTAGVKNAVNTWYNEN